MEEKIPKIHRLNNTKFLWVIVVMLSGISSCKPEIVYENYRMIGRGGWHKDSTMVYNFNISDTLCYYSLFLNIRNFSDYELRNLWLDIDITYPDGHTESEIKEIVLADNFGNWVGSGIGDLSDLQVKHHPDRFFTIPGEYTVCIKHKMRTTVLKGIRDFGISVKKAYRGEE